MSSLQPLFLLTLIVLCSNYSAASPASVTIHDEALVHMTPPYFVSYTEDTANFFPKHDAFINMSSPQFQYMAKKLNPAILRIGGTSADYVYYFDKEDGTCSSLPPTTDRPYHCFTRSILEMIMDFVFGLSAGYPLYPNKTSAPWNSSNTRTFLEYIVDNGYGDRFYGFEVGNEINMDAGPQWQADAFSQLKSLLQEIYGRKGLKIPLLIGSDPHSYSLRKNGSEWNSITKFINLTCDILDMYTYHSYVDQNASALLTVDGINEQHVESKRYGDAVHTYCPNGSQLIAAGEIAAWNGGGHKGICPDYEDVIWYLDAMGSIAALGQDVVMRQQFWGFGDSPGGYSLIMTPEYKPKPSYWIAVLFTQLMGRGVLNVTSNDPELRVYAHCHESQGDPDGSVVMAFVNIHSESIGLEFDSDSLGAAHLDYVLTPNRGNLSSPDMLLNGELLSKKIDNTLPDLNGKESQENPILLEAYSVGFVHFNDSKLKICGAKV